MKNTKGVNSTDHIQNILGFLQYHVPPLPHLDMGHILGPIRNTWCPEPVTCWKGGCIQKMR